MIVFTEIGLLELATHSYHGKHRVATPDFDSNDKGFLWRLTTSITGCAINS